MAENWERTLDEVEAYLTRLAQELDRGEHLESHAEPHLPVLDPASLPDIALPRFAALLELSSTLTQRYAKALVTARESANLKPRSSEHLAGEYLNERA